MVKKMNPDSKKHILVVDDEKDICTFLKDVLSNAGYEVDVAYDGKGAINMVQTNHFDLILMDMFMPGMSGRETFEKLLEKKLLQDVKLAFLTIADLSTKIINELIELGMVGYKQKPITAKELTSWVKKLLK